MKPRAGKAAERGRSDIRAAFFLLWSLSAAMCHMDDELKSCLKSGGIDSQLNVRHKLRRGKFKVVFLLRCLEAFGASSLQLQD
jgi:hypothetical protein